MDIKSIRQNLVNIISTISNLTNMEYAVFDTNSQLVSSTKVYLEKKGPNVHSASIEEVLNQGNVIVNKPGHMLSCIGCRFVNNCPSTIELLSCIKLNNVPIGVLSLTSFSQEGHNMIESNIRSYMELLEYISNLITMFAANEAIKQNTQILHSAIDEIIKEMGKNLIIINKDGLLIHWDKSIEKFFSYCNLYPQTIYQMFPDEITNWLFSTKRHSKKYFSTKDYSGNLYLTPLIIDNAILGYILRLEEENKKSLDHPRENYGNYLESIISKSSEMEIVKEKIRKIGNSSSSVLITGETGTGKEMVAKAIHYTSNRKSHPFVPINCANIPETIFESELFGYEEGAFTGAKKGGKLGLFEMANGGTIFLDEIGELPLHLQAKLLRVLQENTIQRLGSITSVPVDIRIITATNKDLEIMMNEKKFRDDLFYRLNVIHIYIPPLNKRSEDIEILTKHFVKKYSNKLNKEIFSVSNEAMDVLKSHSWLGNIRELENTIEYAINMEDTNIIQKYNLPDRINSFADKIIDIKDMVLEKEIDVIINALNKNGWDTKGKEKAAKELGISVRTLYRKLKHC
ncbi:sigma 54-interacting transcriptional regulator [Proteiniborus sp. MB09-C3]|uniref:sigma-54 interaction domain-containing protein n=1 Tax=Proteiniborus sp. MB09-C3 TaxID=3050072 RepID=UPI00255761C8|nr:sigma 54-interacting transcriptional regulator [Proteiniborus sp. MB09-C3]WIV11649.1 sigma 54-interacting transcriptional regulator [Proteiniborus sp. MB09-C3]